MAPFGLSLYRLLARGRTTARSERAERPAGRLIWLHAGDDEMAGSLAELGRRIVEEDGHPVLLTATALPQSAPEGVILQPAEADTPATVTAQLDHWLPDAIIHAGSEVRPALIHAAAERGIPQAMIEARAPRLPSDRDGLWYPGLMKASLSCMQEILAVDEPAARALRKAGGGAALSITGRLEQPSAVLPVNTAEHEALARLMNTRPVWLAAAVPQAEEAAVIEAHRAGLRHAHRLLLILVPEIPARIDGLLPELEQREGWQVASRLMDQDPTPETEVYLADSAELGLWYRLAPITFLGGSLAGAGCIRNPMEAAALGSSLIHGPRPGTHGALLGRLGAARAARSVASGADLADALSDLLSPDRAARLAAAAWAVTSEGVEVTERAHLLLRQMLGEA